MEKYQQISSKIIIGLSALWLILVITKSMSIGLSYMYLGGLGILIGIQNIILLNISQRTGKLPKKILVIAESRGTNSAIKSFVAINILLYMIVGAIAMVSGFKML